MITQTQKQAAKKNIRKAQQVWRQMSQREHSLAQPQGRSRRKPGTGGGGGYYRINVRPKEQFVTFRTQDVGRPGHTQRIAGKRRSGRWDTQTWLVSKEDAHMEDGRLVIDVKKAKQTLGQVRGPISHVKGDVFEAKPRKNVPESEKPTPAQRRAQRANIKKAQQARRVRA